MRRGAIVAIVTASAVAVLGAGAAGAVLFLPEVQGLVTGSAADGSEVLVLGASAETTPVAEFTPPADWWVQPHGTGGWLLRTPDRQVSVIVGPVTATQGEAALASAAASGAPALRETLASGFPVRHVTDGSRLIAVVETAGGPVLVEATAADAADPARYRPALAELLEGLRAAGHAAS